MSKETSKLDVILFVDDEKICHTFTRLSILDATEYKVVSAYDGQHAIAMAEEYSSNLCLILSDMVLPDMNGYNIYQILKNDVRFCDIPFLFQSGLEFREMELIRYSTDKNIPSDINSIRKPYSKSQLVQAIHDTMAQLKETC